jgi:hypothetical protein
MRDWLLVTAPPAAVVYFIVYPRQFMDLLNWLGMLLH